MTRRFFLLRWLILSVCALAATGTAATTDEEDQQPDYIVRRLTPPAVVSITVTKPSARFDFGQNTDCSTFALNPRHVRFFLRHAQAISKRDYNNYAPWTECYAEGTVRYANGMRAEWSIEVGGRGMLMPTNGRRKNVVYFLYCEVCEGMGWRK